MADVDSDPREALERLLTDVEPSPDLGDRVSLGLARQARRSRARVLLVAAAVLVAAGLAAALLVDRGGEERPTDVITDAPSTTSAPTTAPGSTTTTIEPSRTTTPTTVLTDDRLPAAPTTAEQVGGSAWQEVAPAPIETREAAAWGAGDRYLVVWGGSVDITGEVEQDGAVLDSATGTWRPLGPFPEVPGRTGATLLVTGSIAYLVGGGTGVGGTEPTGEVARFDLEAGTAEVVATSDLAARVSPVVAVRDDRLVVAGGLVDPPGGTADLRTAALDLATGEWEDGADLPWGVSADAFLAGRLRGSAAAVTDDAILLAQARDDPEPSVELARLDRASLQVDPLPSVPMTSSDIAIDEGRLSVLGDLAVIVVESGPVEVVGVDLTTGKVAWRAPGDVAPCESDVEVQAIAGSAVVVASGCSDATAFVDAAGRTTTLPPVALAGSGGPGRLVAVGNALVVVELGNPGDDPNKGPSRPSRTLALAAPG